MSASLLSQRDGPEWEIKELTPDGGDTAGVNLRRTPGLGDGGASSFSPQVCRLGRASSVDATLRHHVRFTTESGHPRVSTQSPLSANSGLMHRSNQLFDHLVVRPSAFCGREVKGRCQTHDYLTKAASCRPIPTGRLERNHDFLKEKTSGPQSLYCPQGASLRHETNGARHADLQIPLSQTNHRVRERQA